MQPLVDTCVSTPAFLGKLWKMVNDPDTDHLICWSPSGDSFIIQNQAHFWYELLPLYYKHNNMSSFVRQLNMYGFHKISTVDSGSLDADKDEIQFTHTYFKKDHPELLRNVKRKATTTKVANNENSAKHDDLTRVLTDVRQLKGRQANVDTQLSNMKQENAMLWREVVMLRQKHMKQQKIVNKLIHFLINLVHPPRMGVGPKRGYHLMLNESPTKKQKASDNNESGNSAEGPTIHELDSELDMPTNLYEDTPIVHSPTTSTSSQQAAEVNSPLGQILMQEEIVDQDDDGLWDKPEFITLSDKSPSDGLDIPEATLSEEALIDDLQDDSTVSEQDQIFLNSSASNTLLSNLIDAERRNTPNETKNGNVQANNGRRQSASRRSPSVDPLAVATRDNLCDMSMPGTSEAVFPDNLNDHIESTQSELDQFKDILNGYNSLDANALLGLFSEDPPMYDMTDIGSTSGFPNNESDPLISGTGSELAPYGVSFDFSELLNADDSLDADTSALEIPLNEPPSSTVNTPQVIKEEPLFPISKK